MTIHYDHVELQLMPELCKMCLIMHILHQSQYRE